MTRRLFVLAGVVMALGACTLPPAYPPIPGLAEPASSAMLAELARVEGLGAAQRRREVAELENLRRLDAPRRFQLAALLAREDSSESLERSLLLLNALPAPDTRTEALLDLMKKSLKTRLELTQQTARSQALQDKLEQIKALEKSLQQRNGLPKAP